MLGGTEPERAWRFDPRRIKRRVRVRRSEWAVVFVAGVLGLLATAWALWPQEPSRLLFTEPLPGGRMFECYHDGALLVTGDEERVEVSEGDRADFERLSRECETRRR